MYGKCWARQRSSLPQSELLKTVETAIYGILTPDTLPQTLQAVGTDSLGHRLEIFAK